MKEQDKVGKANILPTLCFWSITLILIKGGQGRACGGGEI